jgi:hypothetical protein
VGESLPPGRRVLALRAAGSPTHPHLRGIPRNAPLRRAGRRAGLPAPFMPAGEPFGITGPVRPPASYHLFCKTNSGLLLEKTLRFLYVHPQHFLCTHSLYLLLDHGGERKPGVTALLRPALRLGYVGRSFEPYPQLVKPIFAASSQDWLAIRSSERFVRLRPYFAQRFAWAT